MARNDGLMMLQQSIENDRNRRERALDRELQLRQLNAQARAQGLSTLQHAAELKMGMLTNMMNVKKMADDIKASGEDRRIRLAEHRLNLYTKTQEAQANAHDMAANARGEMDAHREALIDDILYQEKGEDGKPMSYTFRHAWMEDLLNKTMSKNKRFSPDKLALADMLASEATEAYNAVIEGGGSQVDARAAARRSMTTRFITDMASNYPGMEEVSRNYNTTGDPAALAQITGRFRIKDGGFDVKAEIAGNDPEYDINEIAAGYWKASSIDADLDDYNKSFRRHESLTRSAHELGVMGQYAYASLEAERNGEEPVTLEEFQKAREQVDADERAAGAASAENMVDHIGGDGTTALGDSAPAGSSTPGTAPAAEQPPAQQNTYSVIQQDPGVQGTPEAPESLQMPKEISQAQTTIRAPSREELNTLPVQIGDTEVVARGSVAHRVGQTEVARGSVAHRVGQAAQAVDVVTNPMQHREKYAQAGRAVGGAIASGAKAAWGWVKGAAEDVKHGIGFDPSGKAEKEAAEALAGGPVAAKIRENRHVGQAGTGSAQGVGGRLGETSDGSVGKSARAQAPRAGGQSAARGANMTNYRGKHADDAAMKKVMTAFKDSIGTRESSGNYDAKNPKSSATGKYQFVQKTWAQLLMRHRPDLTGGETSIKKVVANKKLMALRTDPTLSEEMMDNLMDENVDLIKGAGLAVTEQTMYLAHFLGSSNFRAVVRASKAQKVSDILPKGVLRMNPHLKSMTVGDLWNWAKRGA